MKRHRFCNALIAVVLLGVALVTAAGDADVGTSPPSFAADVGSLGGKPIDFDHAWRADKGGGLSEAGNAALKLASRGNGYWKNVLPGELSQPGTNYKHLSHNLDVGRHEILKSLITRATAAANKRLVAGRMSPLKRVQTVNSGSTGNVTRDIDMTAMVGEGMREQIFMESLEAEARAMGLAETKYDRKAGLSIPQLEVEIHRGSMSPPQLHECLDLQEFTLKYDKVVEAQVRNPEAYIGGGGGDGSSGPRHADFQAGQDVRPDV